MVLEDQMVSLEWEPTLLILYVFLPGLAMWLYNLISHCKDVGS